jgi:hypothetical protein
VTAGGDHFFAGEVVRILNLAHLNYDQLHRLFALVSTSPARREPGEWRRFSFLDLANLKVAAELLGAGPRRVQRLRLKQLEVACAHLREQFGLEHPLLQAKLHSVDTTIVVEVDGKSFDASLSQRVFSALARDVAAYDERRSLQASRKSSGVARRELGNASERNGAFEVPVLAVGRAK